MIRASKKIRRKIGRLIKAGKLPAQRYTALSCDRQSGVLFLFSRNATIVAYAPDFLRY